LSADKRYAISKPPRKKQLMAPWQERRDWRKEFKSLGIEQTRDRIRISLWDEEKLQEARRWLRWQEHRHHYISVVVAAVVAIGGIVVAYFK
jgi:hypothetical protein